MTKKYNTISEAIQAGLQQTGISQKELSQQMNVTQSTVSRWLKGIRVPSKRIIPNLADTLFLNEEHLFELASKQRELNKTQKFDGPILTDEIIAENTESVDDVEAPQIEDPSGPITVKETVYDTNGDGIDVNIECPVKEEIPIEKHEEPIQLQSEAKPSKTNMLSAIIMALSLIYGMLQLSAGARNHMSLAAQGLLTLILVMIGYALDKRE